MFRSKRLSMHYLVRKKRDTIFIHHTPFWPFYFFTKKGFLKQRSNAYETLVSLLEGGRGYWENVKFVKAYSLWLDYSYETKHVEVQHASLFFRSVDFLLRLGNIRNWFIPKSLFKNIRRKELYVLNLSRDDFIKQYKGGM